MYIYTYIARRAPALKRERQRSQTPLVSLRRPGVTATAAPAAIGLTQHARSASVGARPQAQKHWKT